MGKFGKAKEMPTAGGEGWNLVSGAVGQRGPRAEPPAWR